MMISALKQLVAPSSEPLHLYWSFRDSVRKHPAVMMHFDTSLPTFPELGIHATYAEVGTGARVGDSRLHAGSAGVWSMINSYSTGVNRPRRTCRRRRW